MCTALGVVGDEHPDLRIGMIYTCHTFGRDLFFKPHVHIVVTKGGLDKDGNWVEIDGIPGNRLAAKWRYLLCKELRRLRPYDDALRMTIDHLYRRFRGFQVYPDSFYPKDTVLNVNVDSTTKCNFEGRKERRAAVG